MYGMLNSSTETRLALRVVARTVVAEGVVAFDLEAADYLPLPSFEAGAHLEIDCGGVPRQYSLCGNPADMMCYRIAVQNDVAGRGGSRYLCETVQIGDTLDALGPRNHFPMVQSTLPPLLISGGIGITPMLSMAWSLHNAGMTFEMHDFAATRERQAFVEALLSAPWQACVTRYLTRCTDFPALIGRFTPGRHLYVCGPLAMIDAVLDAGRAMGWPEDHLHCERFAAPALAASPSDADADAPFDVQVASTGRRVTVGAGQSVCAALAEVGIAIPMSCEQGVCGSCITRILDGKPAHRDWILTAAEQASGAMFTPCCSRSTTPLLVLDL